MKRPNLKVFVPRKTVALGAAWGLFWGVPIGAAAMLVTQAYHHDISITHQFEQTHAITSGLAKTSLLLKIVESGLGNIHVETRNGVTVMRNGDVGLPLTLSPAESVLLAWSIEGPTETAGGRDRDALLRQMTHERRVHDDTLSPFALQLITTFALKNPSHGGIRWIDDPVILSLIAQDLTRQLTIAKSREGALTLWPRVARCIFSLDALCSDPSQRYGGYLPATKKGPEETPGPSASTLPTADQVAAAPAR